MGQTYAMVVARATGVFGFPHVLIYRHDGSECEEWREGTGRQESPLSKGWPQNAPRADVDRLYYCDVCNMRRQVGHGSTRSVEARWPGLRHRLLGVREHHRHVQEGGGRMSVSDELDDAIRLAKRLEGMLSGEEQQLAHKLRRTLEDVESEVQDLEDKAD
jgi:hypothetical protein